MEKIISILIILAIISPYIIIGCLLILPTKRKKDDKIFGMLFIFIAGWFIATMFNSLFFNI